MRRRTEKCVWVGAALVLAALLTACGGSSKPPAGSASNGGAGSSKQYSELRWGMTPFPGGLDVTKTAWGTTYAVEKSLAVQNLGWNSNLMGKSSQGLPARSNIQIQRHTSTI